MMTALETARRNAGLSQEALAKKAGTDRPMISLYETRKRTPKLETIVKLASALGIKPRILADDFACNSEQKPNAS